MESIGLLMIFCLISGVAIGWAVADYRSTSRDSAIDGELIKIRWLMDAMRKRIDELEDNVTPEKTKE